MGQPKLSFSGISNNGGSRIVSSGQCYQKSPHSWIDHSDIRTCVLKTFRAIDIRSFATDVILNTLCCLKAMKLSIYIHIVANSFYLFITSWHLQQISEITWSETGFSIKMLLYLLTVMTYYAVFLWYCRYLFYIYYISRSLFLCMNIFYETYFANIYFSFYPFRCGIKCVYVYANFYRVLIWWCHKMYTLLLMPESNAWYLCLLLLLYE